MKERWIQRRFYYTSFLLTNLFDFSAHCRIKANRRWCLSILGCFASVRQREVVENGFCYVTIEIKLFFYSINGLTFDWIESLREHSLSLLKKLTTTQKSKLIGSSQKHWIYASILFCCVYHGFSLRLIELFTQIDVFLSESITFDCIWCRDFPLNEQRAMWRYFSTFDGMLSLNDKWSSSNVF